MSDAAPMPSYIAATRLRAMMLEIIRAAAPTCIAIDLEPLPGPFQPRNWRIGRLDVGCEDYGAARDEADALMGSPRWIMVPDGHPLDGQAYGRDERR